MGRADLVSHSAKQGELRGGFQGGIACVEPLLMLPAPNQKSSLLPLTKGDHFKCFFSLKKNPKTNPKEVVSEAFGVFLKATPTLGEGVSWPPPARSLCGTQPGSSKTSPFSWHSRDMVGFTAP